MADFLAIKALIAKKSAIELSILRVELFLGVFIGAITFTGSVIAYGKLSGKVTSAATKLPGGHALNAGAAIISILSLIWYLQTGDFLAVVVMTLMASFIGFHLIMGIGGAPPIPIIRWKPIKDAMSVITTTARKSPVCRYQIKLNIDIIAAPAFNA